jgi:predicted dinucleotide-binding enzyme
LSVDAIGSETADLVFLAVPYDQIADVATTYKGFEGKTVVDITNPVDFNTFQLIPSAGTAGAEEVAKLLPKAIVVKAFNTTFAGTLLTGEVAGKPLDVFIAGDEQAAKDAVAELVKAGGMRPIDVGPLSNARHLEGFQLLHMAAQQQLDTNWMSALTILN